MCGARRSVVEVERQRARLARMFSEAEDQVRCEGVMDLKISHKLDEASAELYGDRDDNDLSLGLKLEIAFRDVLP
jgi:hypothetical protein